MTTGSDMELWFISQKQNGKRYFYMGTENGRRGWTDRKRDAYFFYSREAAMCEWDEIGRVGDITGIDSE